MARFKRSRSPKSRVFGLHVSGPRLTPLGAALVASCIAVPCGVLLWLIDAAVR